MSGCNNESLGPVFDAIETCSQKWCQFINDPAGTGYYDRATQPPSKVMTLPHLMRMLEHRYFIPVFDGTWTPETQYGMNSIVSQNGEYWICRQPHVSTSSFESDVAAGLWLPHASTNLENILYGLDGFVRTLYEKLGDIRSVKDFGAKGNGFADDTTAIKKALEYGGRIYFPEGTYIISDQIPVYSHTSLWGSGMDSAIIKMKNGVDPMLHMLVSANATAPGARSCNDANVDQVVGDWIVDVSIKALTIDANKNNRPAYAPVIDPVTGYRREPGTNIEAHKCRDWLLDEVRTQNPKNHGFNVRAGTGSYNMGYDYVPQHISEFFVVRNCISDEVGDDNFTTHDSRYVTFYNCQSWVRENADPVYGHAKSNGIEIDDGSHYCYVLNCYSNGPWAGFQAKGHANTTPAHHVVFENCVAENVQFGITLGASQSPNNDSNSLYATCHDIVVRNHTVLNPYVFSNIASWTDQGHYVKLNNTRNVFIDGLRVVNALRDMPNKAAADKQNLFIRIHETNAHVRIQNVTIENAENSIYDGDNFWPIRSEGASTHLQIDNLVVDAYLKGPIVRATNATYFAADNIKLLRGSPDHAVIWTVGAGGGTARIGDNIYGNGSKSRYRYNDTYMPSLDRGNFSYVLPQGGSVGMTVAGYSGGEPGTGAAITLTHRVGTEVGTEITAGRISTIVNGGSVAGGDLQSHMVFSIKPGSASTASARLYLRDTVLHPNSAGSLNLGSGGLPWGNLYVQNNPIVTSDERVKTDIAAVPKALLEAWGDVEFYQFRYASSVEEKGDKARLHVGLIAQKVQTCLEKRGFDPFALGLLCFDAWGESVILEKELVKEAEYDEAGNLISPEQYQETTIIIPAGEMYSLRYEQCAMLEAAYQRWRLQQLERRLDLLDGEPA